MGDVLIKSNFKRLEDFIALAKKGKKVHMSIEFRKQIVTEKVHPKDTLEQKGEIDMYLLIGAYSFKVGEEVMEISKVYMFGSTEEPLNVVRENKNIANQRLKMDYKRFREAKIIFEDKYFYG